MKDPFVFQSLEQELAPTLKYVNGAVLNAGCGERDLTLFLMNHGAESVENCDVRTSIPNAIIADLANIPRPGASYDTIICNAVLEHAQFPDQVMCELYRVLKPEGHLILCVPFMQPFHASPTDYRRYSRQGLLELARIHHFEPLEILPVHSLAQTITWIWWSHLSEKRRRFQMALLWLPFFMWCRISRKTDLSAENQANGFQVVVRKAALVPEFNDTSDPRELLAEAAASLF